VGQVLAESEEVVAVIRDRLLSAVGQHGQLLLYVIPSLKLLIGGQTAVKLDLGISEVQSLYTQLFTRLVDVFSRYDKEFLVHAYLILQCRNSLAHLVVRIVKRQAEPSAGDVLGRLALG
jgi:hypothetical protein